VKSTSSAADGSSSILSGLRRSSRPSNPINPIMAMAANTQSLSRRQMNSL